MEKLIKDLNDLNGKIHQLEDEIAQAQIEAENNIAPLKEELEQVRKDKRDFGRRNDFESVQSCKRKEENLKFRISSQWNLCSILKNDLSNLKSKRHELEDKIKLEKDKIKRNNDILAKMDEVLENYRKTQNLQKAAVDSKLAPENVEQWFDWGKNDFNEVYSYFYNQIQEIDNYFKLKESERLKKQMDDVVDAYGLTQNLQDAARIAHVSYDTVQYWYEWGSRGFGEENTYFFKKISVLMKK